METYTTKVVHFVKMCQDGDTLASVANSTYYNFFLLLSVHNEELNDLYCSPNIVRVIISRIMRWAGM